MTLREPVLVVGLGNELFTDEGVGLAAVRRIAERALPGVAVLEGATAGLGIMPEVEGRDAVLVLDAVVARGASPGDVLVLDGAALPYRDGPSALSPHQIGILDALAAAEFAGRAPVRVTAVGMVPVSLDPGYGLSPAAEARLDDMVATALAVLAGWGVAVGA